MQWLFSVVAVVCLVAAGPARPEEVRARGESRQLLSATSTAPALLSLRQGQPRPALRSWPYDAPSPPVVERPLRAVEHRTPLIAADIAEPVPPVPLSRGPPRG